MTEYLEIGEVVSVHGLKGDIKLYPWSDSAKSLTKLKHIYLSNAGSDEHEIEKMSVQKNMILMKLKGVDTVEAARHYIGKVFYASRKELPLRKGQFFVCDILGLKVVDADSDTVYGTITDVSNNGAHDYYEIKNDSGETFYLPAIKEFVISIDIDAGEVRVKPIKGMFDNED